MEKNQKRIAADCSEFHLPEEIIRHIQSFMKVSEASQTTLLSKSWFSAWSTRPNIDFDQLNFENCTDKFPDFAKKTMQRYEDRNRKIQTFRLRMIMYEYEDHCLASELILKAIKLGAHNLDIVKLGIHNLDIFVLADELLQSKTLTRLSVRGCSIDVQRRRKKEVIVTFSNLKSLNLSGVIVKGDLFEDFISRCPSIEELTLENPMSSVDTPLPFDVAKLTKLHKLKYLRLEGLDIGDCLLRSDLWPKFACLKELVIENPSHRVPNVSICSTSLDRIILGSCNNNRNMNVEVNVPNLKKFEFKSDDLPRLGNSSMEWEADVEITCYLQSTVSALWFSSLNQLAKMLGRSRVSLFLSLQCDQRDGDGYCGDGLAIPTVENLTIMGYRMFPAFLDVLFCSCRPNLVSIERQALLGVKRVNVEEFRHLCSLPWEELLDPSEGIWELVRFQLK